MHQSNLGNQLSWSYFGQGISWSASINNGAIQMQAQSSGR